MFHPKITTQWKKVKIGGKLVLPNTYPLGLEQIRKIQDLRNYIGNSFLIQIRRRQFYKFLVLPVSFPFSERSSHPQRGETCHWHSDNHRVLLRALPTEFVRRFSTWRSDRPVGKDHLHPHMLGYGRKFDHLKSSKHNLKVIYLKDFSWHTDISRNEEGSFD